MLREITWEHFCEWRAYDELEPLGDDRADIRTAHIVQTLVNLHRGKNREPYKLSEFVLPFGDYKRPVPQQQSWQVMKQMLGMYFGVGNDDPNKLS